MVTGAEEVSDYGGQKTGAEDVSDVSISLELLIILRASLVSLVSLILVSLVSLASLASLVLVSLASYNDKNVKLDFIECVFIIQPFFN